MPHRFLENITTADVAFEATGKTPEELFISAATALEETQVNTKQLANRTRKKVGIKNVTLDGLLFDFLDELVFLKDAEGLVFCEYDIKIHRYKDIWGLEGSLRGETLNPKHHELRTDVKAVTKHRFGIQKTPEGLKATVVLDI